jgi:hypothetical protein
MFSNFLMNTCSEYNFRKNTFNLSPEFIINFSIKSVESSSLSSEVRTPELEISTVAFSRFNLATGKFEFNTLEIDNKSRGYDVGQTATTPPTPRTYC